MTYEWYFLLLKQILEFWVNSFEALVGTQLVITFQTITSIVTQLILISIWLWIIIDLIQNIVLLVFSAINQFIESPNIFLLDQELSESGDRLRNEIIDRYVVHFFANRKIQIKVLWQKICCKSLKIIFKSILEIRLLTNFLINS